MQIGAAHSLTIVAAANLFVQIVVEATDGENVESCWRFSLINIYPIPRIDYRQRLVALIK